MTTYKHLRAWCNMMGSYPYYVKDQIEKARRTKAPDDAIYEKYDRNGPTGEWARYQDVTNVSTRAVMDRNLAEVA